MIAFFGAQAIYAASLPFWFINVMTQYANSMNARFESINSQFGASTPPPDVAASIAQANSAANVMATIQFYVLVAVAIGVSVAIVVAATKRWEWAFYVIIVVLGFEFVWASSGVVFALIPSVLIPGAPPPGPVILPEIGFGTLAAGVAVWMVVVLVKRGPWAMRRIS